MTNEILKIEIQLLKCKVTRSPADFPRVADLQRVVPALSLQNSVENIWRRLGK